MKKNVFYLMSMALTMFLFIGVTKTEAQVTIGTDAVPISGALLDLKQNAAAPDSTTATKGLMYPRVALKEPRELKPMFNTSTTPDEKKAHIGLTVYNVTNDNVFTPGIYVWDGESWIRPVTKLAEAATVNKVILQSPINTTDGGPNAELGDNGDELDFGTITIPERGSYAFTFRLYGEILNVTATRTATYYLSLWKNDSNYANQQNLIDLAEMNFVILQTTSTISDIYTYSITMSGSFDKNDVVKIKIANDPGNDLIWKLASIPGSITSKTTSMVWWRL